MHIVVPGRGVQRSQSHRFRPVTRVTGRNNSRPDGPRVHRLILSTKDSLTESPRDLVNDVHLPGPFRGFNCAPTLFNTLYQLIVYTADHVFFFLACNNFSELIKP